MQAPSSRNSAARRLPMSPAEFGKLVADETEKWGAVVKSAVSVE